MERPTIVLLPKFDIPFNIHADMRNYQLEGIVLQEKPITFFYIKLTDTKNNNQHKEGNTQYCGEYKGIKGNINGFKLHFTMTI